MQVLRRSFAVTRSNQSFSSHIRSYTKISQILPDFSAPVFNHRAETTTFPNGLRVSTYPVEFTNAASVTLVVKSGSRFETEETNGANFFLQKLAFRTGHASGKKTLAEAVEDIGGTVELKHDRESVSYTINVDASQLKAATNLLGKMVTNLSDISLHQVESIRSQVLGEKNRLESKRDFLASDHLHSIIYQQGTLGFPFQGTAANLESTSPQTLSNIVQRFYTAENMSIAAVGNFIPQAFNDSVSNAFAAVSTSREAISSEPSRYYGSIVTERDDSSPDVLVTVAYEGTPIGSPDSAPISVIREIVGDYDFWTGAGNNHSGRLAELVSTERSATSFKTFNKSYSDAGVFGVTLISQGKHLDNVVCEVCSEFVRLAHNARPAEVSRAKNSLKNRILANHDGIAEISRTVAHDVLHEGWSRPLKTRLDEVEDVTVEQVRKVAGDKFTDAEPGVVGIGATLHVPDYNQIRGWTHWWRI